MERGFQNFASQIKRESGELISARDLVGREREMNLKNQAVALTSLLLIILILTGSIAGTIPRVPVLGGLAPILILTFMTWYLILLIVKRNDIITALAAMFLPHRKGTPTRTNFLISIIGYAFFIGVTIILLWSGLLQRLLSRFQGVTITPETGNQTLPPPQMNPISRFMAQTYQLGALYYGILVSAAIFVFSFFIFLRGFDMALRDRRALSEEHESDTEVKEEAVEVLEHAIASLKQTKEYHETILQCYKSMCKVLSEAGLVISSTETAREFVESISAKLQVGRDAVRGLTFLFEEARYSDHQITEQKRIMAVNHLESLQQVLSRDVGLGA